MSYDDKQPTPTAKEDVSILALCYLLCVTIRQKTTEMEEIPKNPGIGGIILCHGFEAESSRGMED